MQSAQDTDALGDMADMGIERGVDLRAALFRGIAQSQQIADFVQRHVQRPAIEDELQTFALRIGVEPEVAITARGLGQQPFMLVVADGFHRHRQPGGQFSDSIGGGHEVLRRS